MEYTQYVNSMQQYGRLPAEMALGTYEIVATKEYCRNNTLPNPPAVVFVIDVSYNAIKNGLVQTICDNIMDIIETTAYNELGQSCSAAGVCVQLFVCNNAYADAATLGQLPRLTGGQLHKYTYFVADTDGARLAWDVKRTVTRPTGHDAVMRVRTSTGVRATEFYGHFFMSNTTDVELAAIDSDKAIGVEIKHDDKLTAEDGVYVQAALLYTHRSGQRRLRVLNLALAVAHQLADVYRATELDTCINFLTKQAVWALREATPRQVREGLTSRCAKSLAAYRRHCASPSSVGQLVLPESMKLLPLYTSCVLRSDAIAGGQDITCDDRSCAMYRALTADVSLSLVYTYPRLLPLDGLPSAPPQPLRASVDKMSEMGVYLLENGVHMLIWVGSQASSEWVSEVFGVASPQHVDTHVCELPELDNPTSVAVRDLVLQTRIKRKNAMRLTVMRQHDKLETVLRHFLVEDRGVDGSSSYVDYLCHIHKEIRALL
ncbi:jg16866 [Pararge aegeria aegeria]|uniref:Jg16866 protein n=2 Tax=Pararge aegeria TaxID=116150 RepID=A0A8S4SQL4_9NEOP|nr:jg16866 [Pararge aegeria aegeria]